MPVAAFEKLSGVYNCPGPEYYVIQNLWLAFPVFFYLPQNIYMNKNIVSLLFVFIIFAGQKAMGNQFTMTDSTPQKVIQQDSVLRHVVMFKYKDGITPQRITEIQDAFAALQDKIPQIHSYEWGTNNSPENLNKGFTHCVIITFLSEEDRDIYLPHPDHKAFGDFLGSDVADVLVVDFWN